VKACDILKVRTYSDPSYKFSGGPDSPTPIDAEKDLKEMLIKFLERSRSKYGCLVWGKHGF